MKRAGYLLMVLVFAGVGVAQDRAKIPAPPVPTDGHSLQAYLLTMLNAEQAGDVDTVGKLADGLKLPDPAQWLSNAFGSDQTNSLADKYDRSFLAFRSRLIENFKWADQAVAKISVEYRTKPREGVATSSAAPVPRTFVDVETFKCVLVAAGKGRSEWMDSYARVDGKLRYIGQGAFPFWAGPLSIRIKRKTH